VYPALRGSLRRVRDNASGGGNQQERLRCRMLNVGNVPPHIGHYMAGFADGEGSFNVSFRPRSDYRQPWKVSLCFNISQRDRVILALFKRHLECGTMRSRPDGVWYYEVNNLNAILENVIPFFQRFSFLSAKKKRDFAKFCQIAEMIRRGEHSSEASIRQILDIRREMNDGGKRRYEEAEILQRFQPGESSETVRRTPERAEMIQSGLRGDTQSG
jgi:LAGLIDADG DNA endonuclease family protein